MAATVLRVKRRCEDEPLNAFLIACKRCKSSETDEAAESVNSTPLTTILKFAGTLESQDNDVVQQLAKTVKKDDLKSNYKQHPVDILNKARERAKQNSADTRYKVVNCFRSIDTADVEEFEDKVLTVIDVEYSISYAGNDLSSDTVKDDAYEYDLYYAPTEEDMDIQGMSILALEEDLVFESYRDAHYENECPSEDSNSESNWRNDYPDSDNSEKSIDENDMREAVKNMKLEEGSDLSSEDDFVYAVNEKDVESYGYKYAKYKAKIKEELGEDDESDTSSTGAHEATDQSSDDE